MRKRNLKSKLMLFGLIAACIVIIALVVVIVLGKKSLDKTREQAEQLSEELTSNRRLVYVASRNIEKGEQVTEDNVMEQMIYTGLGASSYMSASELGQTATVDIHANEPVMAGMVTPIKITKDMRKYEVASAHLMTTQSIYDTIDIRIMFPNGEDYLLLAKKPVMDLQMGTSVFTTYMNEDEILRMSSAMVDAYTTTGAKIYTTKYVEENIQEEATPNYPVKAAVLDLINADPNIVEQAETTLNLRARNDLDQRLGSLSDEQLKAMSAGLNIEDTAKSSVIREGIIKESREEKEEPAKEEPAQEQPEQQEPAQEEPEQEQPALTQPDFDYGTGQEETTGDGNTVTIELTE